MTAHRSALRLASASADPGRPTEGSDRTPGVLGMLAVGIPLTLLIDLASPLGPDSRAIFDAESFEAAMLRTA